LLLVSSSSHLFSSHSVPLPVSMHAGCHNLWTQLRPKQVYTFFCVWGLVNRFSHGWDFATESGHEQVLGQIFINANMKLWKLLSVGLRVRYFLLVLLLHAWTAQG
jgi:hypothetical protein